MGSAPYVCPTVLAPRSPKFSPPEDFLSDAHWRHGWCQDTIVRATSCLVSEQMMNYETVGWSKETRMTLERCLAHAQVAEPSGPRCTQDPWLSILSVQIISGWCYYYCKGDYLCHRQGSANSILLDAWPESDLIEQRIQGKPS